MEEKPPRFEDWFVAKAGDHNYSPVSPETRPCVLLGNMYGRSGFDGTFAHTAQVVQLDRRRHIAVSAGGQYRLGKVNSAYEKKFPNAVGRFFSLKGVEIRVFVVAGNLKIYPVMVPVRDWMDVSRHFCAKIGRQPIIGLRDGWNKFTTYAGFATRKEARGFRSTVIAAQEQEMAKIKAKNRPVV